MSLKNIPKSRAPIQKLSDDPDGLFQLVMERLDEEDKEDKKKPICRVCLNYDSEKFDQGLSVFEKHNDVYVYEKINYLASIEIEKDDNLPDRICPVCLVGLENACNFKQLCENSDAFLHSTSQTEEPQQVLETDNPIKEEVDEFHYDIYPVNSPTVVESILENSFEPLDYQQDDINTLVEETDVLEFKPKPDFVSKAIDLKLECDDCGGSFKSKCKLKVHWKKVHMPEKLKCSNCKQKFKTYKTLHNHMKRKSLTCVNANKVRVEGEGKYRTYHCKNCNASSKRIQTIVTHLVIHTGEKPYKCDLCNRSFSQLGGVKVHKEDVHKINTKEATCSVCGKLIRGRNNWSRHMKAHKNLRVTCPVCKKTYASKNSMENHMKRHSGVKSYTCEICAKTFYCPSDLANHRAKTHLKSKIYRCEKCEYKSYSHSRMSKHRKKHTPNNVACEICGTFVDNEQQLVLHKKRHEKNVICPLCNRGYFNRKHLLNHVRKKHKMYGLTGKFDDKTKIIKNNKHKT